VAASIVIDGVIEVNPKGAIRTHPLAGSITARSVDTKQI
jgi:hypothetical protein